MLKKIKSNIGITLIELMSTVVIVGIVAAMAVPRFQNAYERMEFRSANRDITSSVRLARSLSISEKKNFGVYLDNEERSITLFLKDPSSTTINSLETADSVIRVDTLTDNFDYMATDISNSAIVFRPNGSSTFTGGGNLITMKYSEDMVGISVINILASTGRIKSYSHYY